MKEEEAKKAEIANKARSELQKLSGERDYLAGEHKKAAEDFKLKHNKTAASVTASDALNGLNTLDAKRYETMMTDLAMGGDSSAPSWANLPFLDRITVNTTADPKV